MRIAGAILAGGKASRMGGSPKGLLRDATGAPLVQRLIGELERAGVVEVVLSVNDPGLYARFGKAMIPDRRADAGPLAGMEAVLDHLRGRCDSVVFLPCDLPGITAAEIVALMRAHEANPDRIVMIATREREHPLCAAVPLGTAPAVSGSLDAGRRGVGRLWRDLGAVSVQVEDAARLININTPEDWDCWRRT